MNTKRTRLTTTFTTRIETDIKARLEQIATYEDRSASYMANQAIKALIEEREATHGLIKTGLALVEKGNAHTETDIDTWLKAPIDTPFPKDTPRL
jgi:predicted transcriptional regulator